MNGLMMDWPLVIPNILRRAGQFFPEKEIVSRRGDGTIVGSNYGEVEKRVHRLMNVLRDLGVKPGDRVATCAWNHQKHLELYFAVPAVGAVLHTINFRLAREQLVYIINHAEDRLIFLDKSLGGILADLQRELTSVDKYILMDEKGASHRPCRGRRLITKSCWRGHWSMPNFPRSMRTWPPGSATRRGPPASLRGSSTVTARHFYTPWPDVLSTAGQCAKKRSYCRSCLCST